MNRTKEDRTTFALRGKTLEDEVRAFSETLAERRSASGLLPRFTPERSADPQAVDAAMAELATHAEELAVAEEELRAQLEELTRLHGSLQSEQLRYRELFDFAPDPAFVSDVAGLIREGNSSAAEALGVTREALRKKPLAAFVDEKDVGKLRLALIALQPGATVTLEVAMRRRDRRPLAAELRAFRSADGDRVLWGVRDVTERRRATTALESTNAELEAHVSDRTQELARALRDKDELLQRERSLRVELETANRAKDRFLAILSHDLRSPLNAVLGWTSLLRREVLDHASRDRALATIERNARVQAELIEQLLDVSRVTAGALQLEMRPVDLGALARAVIESVAPAASAKGVELVDETAGLSAPVLGDAGRLRQVLANLLGNAVKFTPHAGRVTIGLRAVGDVVRLSVLDNGRGIDPRIMPHVFDCFRQAGDAGMQRAGLGFGLFIVRQIVEMHGGQVDAESEGTGHGAAFYVVLPMRRTGEQGELAVTGLPTPPDDSTPELPAETDLDGLRVLVVEDEKDTRELLALALERQGARVLTAVDAETALEVFRALAPDVVVSDVGLPSATGYDLIREIRARSDGATVPALAVTGFASLADARRALDAGFDAHISKPLAPSEVVRAIHKLATERLRSVRKR